MDESFRQLLVEHRASIVRRWRDLVIDSYSKKAARFMQLEKDPFANPVGSTIVRSIDGLWEGLVAERDLEQLAPAVDDICRLRAVQEFKPAQAVAFLPLLKDVVREEVGAARLEAAPLRALLAFESRVDQLTLLAFDTYSACRERVFEIRATELRSRSARVLERLNERLLAKSVAASDEKDTPSPVSDGRGGDTR